MKFRFNETISHISERAIEQNIQKSTKYVKHIQSVLESKSFEQPECSVNAVFDSWAIEQLTQIAQKLVTNKLRYIIIVGIGGSNLGTKAIYDALYGYQDYFDKKVIRPKIIFIDANNPRIMAELYELLETITDPQELLLTIITKSGTTVETIANAEVILNKITTIHTNFETKYKNRVVFITNEKSKLWNFAHENNFYCLGIPEYIGGRYSVFSAVGLFPLACIGVDLKKIITGVKRALNENTRDNRDNPALVSAILLAENLKRGKVINDNFIFHSELESLGKWYRQLMGESIGKQQDLDNNNVFIGITPTVSIGSTDLHSVGQLYLGGPKDKYTTFISTLSKEDVLVSNQEGRIFLSLVPDITQKSFDDILQAILQGTQRAYINQNLPFNDIILDEISAEEIAYFMQFKMLEIMYLGHLLNINPFDQPNVELYKVETKKLLNQE